MKLGLWVEAEKNRGIASGIYRAVSGAAVLLVTLFPALQLSSRAQEASAVQSDPAQFSAASSYSIDPAPLLSGPAGKIYSLRLHHLHTGESLDVVYRIGNEYVPAALDELNHFLRDHRTDDVSHYDPREFDLLHSIMTSLGRPNGIIDIVCGYRTPWSNAFLRHGSAASGVAEHSQHIEAKAIDIRVPGVQTARLRDTAESFQAGGVGYYPVSQFVHVDVGPVRTWSFGRAPRRASLRTAALRRRGGSRRVGGKQVRSQRGRGRRVVVRHQGD